MIFLYKEKRLINLKMKVKLQIEEAQDEEGLNMDEDKKSRLFMKIYKTFPQALWERTGKGFVIFI